ncbi:MAG: ABC transporter ATP-binding protein, partial [Massilia sp.]|nr:ABC transporter ATP-binding protein [Massilia sp.]
MSMQKFIEVQNVEMRFNTRKGSFHALTNVNLTVEQGEFITLIGHSGCGKSTLLNLIAGLTNASDGVLLCASREIAGPSPERAVVFQNHSLLPWLTCYENVHLAVERVFGAKESAAQLRERSNAALELVGLTA